MVCIKKVLSALCLIGASRMQESGSTRSASHISRRSSQDATTAEFEAWLSAWKIPYQGSALRHLETKLQLNVRAVRDISVRALERENMQFMSASFLYNPLE
jgi:hypothetical protein